MCLAAPSRVIELRDGMAVTECFRPGARSQPAADERRVAVGDYVLIQAGGFAFERVEAARAEEALALMRELMEQGGDARNWGDGLEAA
jgi:hydrogenase expression/formation protein HypC